MPTKNNIRIQQSLKLSKEITLKEKQIIELKDNIKMYKSKIYELEINNKTQKNMTDVYDKPYGFLIKDLENKEKYIIELKSENDELIDKLNNKCFIVNF
jgi:hypothetical protein